VSRTFISTQVASLTMILIMAKQRRRPLLRERKKQQLQQKQRLLQIQPRTKMAKRQLLQTVQMVKRPMATEKISGSQSTAAEKEKIQAPNALLHGPGLKTKNDFSLKHWPYTAVIGKNVVNTSLPEITVQSRATLKNS
jgi:hypothetical protein